MMINWQNLEGLRGLRPTQNFVNAEKYFLFKSHFSLGHEAIVSQLEQILQECHHFRLEPSVKVVENEVHANRFNVWFRTSRLSYTQDHLRRMVKAMETVGKFDSDMLQALTAVPHTFSDNVVKAGFGIDLRDDITQCRLKFWLQLIPAGLLQFRKRFPELNNLFADDDGECVLLKFNVFEGGRVDMNPYFLMQNDSGVFDKITVGPSERALLECSHNAMTSRSGTELSLWLNGKFVIQSIDHPIKQCIDPFNYYLFCIPNNGMVGGIAHRFTIVF